MLAKLALWRRDVTIWGMRSPRKLYSYQINLVAEPDGGYTVTVPLLPGCVSYGETIEQATENAREAIALHVENLAAHGEPIPEGQESSVFSTVVHVTPSRV